MSRTLQRIQQHIRPLRAGDNDFRSLIFGVHSQEALEGKRPVIVFGSGAVGRNLVPSLRLNGIEPLAFCDNQPGPEPVCGLEVLPFSRLKTEHPEALVIVASIKYRDAIREQLLEGGFPSDRVLCADRDTDPDLFFAFLTFGAQECVTAFSRPGVAQAIQAELETDRELLDTVYEALSDPLSRELFIRRIALFASGADFESTLSFIRDFSIPVAECGLGVDVHGRENVYYFTNDLMELGANEVLLDGGAFDGDSVEAFAEACTRAGKPYERIHCFEPDPANYAKLLRSTGNYRAIDYTTEAMWDRRETLRFMSAAQCSIPEGAAIAPDGDITVSTISIDEYLQGRRCSFIKMDIQGAELEALRGARQTLLRHKPKLAISAYHKHKDIYEIPYLIHRIRPDYQLHLRHLGSFLYDTVLFAR